MARLPRLPQAAMVDPKSGRPTIAFTVYWQNLLQAQEAIDAAQDTLIADVQQAQADIVAAQADIVAAQADIVAVQADQASQLEQILAVLGLARRTGSYTQPTAVLQASDAGSDATITVIDHRRVYSDATFLDVVGGNIPGLGYETLYAVYYDDPTLSDTTPAYFAVEVISQAQVGAAPGRHFLGVIETMGAGEPDVDGGGAYPPGSGPGGELEGPIP